jgi:hypothetical protein
MSKTDTTLLTSIVEEHSTEGGFTVTRFTVGGEPWAAANVHAAVDEWPRVHGHLTNVDGLLGDKMGEKVTIVRTGENMMGSAMVVAQEGKLFQGSRGPAILPKGARTKGYGIKPETVLAVIDGYRTDVAVAMCEAVTARLPKLVKLTQERLEALPAPAMSETGTDCTLAVFGTWRMPDGDCPGAIWLCGEYDKENDIVDGCVIYLRPEHGESEHGSVYGQQLLSGYFGEVAGFQPIPFGEAVKLCNADYEDVRARILA